MEKRDLLKDVVKHIDIKSYDSTQLIDAMRNMSFTSRDTARAADIFMQMIAEKDCTNILTIAGSTSAAGCMHPILNPPLSSLPLPSLWVVPVHQPQASSIMHRTWTGDSFHI